MKKVNKRLLLFYSSLMKLINDRFFVLMVALKLHFVLKFEEYQN